MAPFRVTVTTRIITFLVGNPYKPLFTTVSGRGDNPRYNLLFIERFVSLIFGLIVKIEFQNMHHLSGICHCGDCFGIWHGCMHT